MRIARYKKSRFWGVYDEANCLVCLCVYKKGAEELLRRFGVEVPERPVRKAKEKQDVKIAAAVSSGKDRSHRGGFRRAAIYRTNP